LTAGTYAIIASGTGGSVAGSVSASTVNVTGSGVVGSHQASLAISGGATVNLVISNRPPVVANNVTNNVTSGLTWKMAIADLKTAAGWSDPDGDAVTLSGVVSLSFNGTSVSSDGTFVYYNGPVTAEDYFTYTVTDPYGATAVGTVYLEAVAGAGTIQNNPATDGNGHPTFSGSGIPGYVYGVESATSLSGPWINAGTVTVGITGAWTFTDAGQVNPPLIFYRLYYPYSAGSPPQ
jgi:predicted nucleotidyltransferase